MKIPELRIADLVAKIPVIQGGMAVRISMAPLAAAVAEEGGIGIIAGSGLSVQELKEEIREARRRTKGIIGVNVMFAVREFAQLVHAAFEEKIDLLVSGAGFSRDMFTWGKEKGIPVVPIVSSAKLAKLSEKLGAAAVVVEGYEAGGHLGTDRSMRDILPEVKAAVSIPVIGAGSPKTKFNGQMSCCHIADQHRNKKRTYPAASSLHKNLFLFLKNRYSADPTSHNGSGPFFVYFI